MNTSKVLNLLLATALVILSVKLAFFSGEKAAIPNSTDSAVVSTDSIVLQNIFTRTSIRAYKQQLVDDKLVTQILKAGMSAPTAMNKQPWSFIVVKDKAMLQALGANLPYAKMIPQAPVVVLACGDLSKAMEGEAAQNWVLDVSAASENILLAAHALGLGAVWTGVYPDKERVKAVQKVLNLPAHIIPLNAIPIGYPGEAPAPKDKWKPENVHYNRW